MINSSVSVNASGKPVSMIFVKRFHNLAYDKAVNHLLLKNNFCYPRY